MNFKGRDCVIHVPHRLAGIVLINADVVCCNQNGCLSMGAYYPDFTVPPDKPHLG